MFDLIDECGSELESYGYKVKKLPEYDITEGKLIVESREKSKEIGLDEGQYYIYTSPFLHENGLENSLYLSKVLARRLKKLFEDFSIKKGDNILVIGLGNPDIQADRLGKEVFDNLEINALDKNNNIFKFCPNIYFATGIETIEMVKFFVKTKSIRLALIIDSLTTSSIARLGTSFQITTSGMTPGSGVNRFGSRICEQSVGAVCLSIGVPFMIYSSSLNQEDSVDILLTPKDVKEYISRAGVIIAKAISEVIQ